MTTPRIPSAHGVAALLAAALLACSGGRESPEAFEANAAVRSYNAALAQAFAVADAGRLAGAASPDEMRRVDDLIGFLAQGKMVMESRQEKYEPGRVAFPKADRAELEAVEVWWYRHWIPSTGEVKQKPRRVRYRNLYKLVRVEGRWLVDRLEERGFEEMK